MPYLYDIKVCRCKGSNNSVSNKVLSKKVITNRLLSKKVITNLEGE